MRHSLATAARLLRTERRTIDKHAAANGIRLAANPDRGCWWNHYYNTAPAAGTDT